MSEPLPSKRQEAFCQIMAVEDVNYGQAAYKAGYTGGGSDKLNSYHFAMGSRLMNMDRIRMRISEIRVDIAEKDKHYTVDLITRLKKVVAFNPLKYYGSSTVTLETGEKRTKGYLRKNLEDWEEFDGQLIAGFDRNGLPRMIDKEWAIEKLLKIYALDGSRQVDIEDLFGLFTNAGLPVNQDNDFSMRKAYLEEAEDDMARELIEDEVDASLESDNQRGIDLDSIPKISDEEVAKLLKELQAEEGINTDEWLFDDEDNDTEEEYLYEED